MAADDPVLSELVALRQSVASLTTNVALNTQSTNSLQRTLDDVRANAVPLGEWQQARRTDELRFKGVEDDVQGLKDDKKADTTFRRTVLGMFAVAAFSAFFSAAVAVALFILGK